MGEEKRDRRNMYLCLVSKYAGLKDLTLCKTSSNILGFFLYVFLLHPMQVATKSHTRQIKEALGQEMTRGCAERKHATGGRYGVW